MPYLYFNLLRTKFAYPKILVITTLFTLNLYNLLAAQWIPTYDKGMKQAKKTGKPVIIDFYTDWCGYCKKLDREVFADAEFKKLAQKFICIKVDCEKDKKTPGEYGIRGYPTIYFLSPKGKILDKIGGYRKKEAFISTMNSVLKKVGPPKKSQIQNVSDTTQTKKAIQFYKLGKKMEELNRLPEAIKYYKKAYQLSPKSKTGKLAQQNLTKLNKNI